MFADELKRIRQKKKWTQKELAEKIHKSVSVISSWERGIRTPNAQSMLSLSKILGIHIENDTIATKKKTEKTEKTQTKTKAITTKQTKTEKRQTKAKAITTKTAEKQTETSATLQTKTEKQTKTSATLKSKAEKTQKKQTKTKKMLAVPLQNEPAIAKNECNHNETLTLEKQSQAIEQVSSVVENAPIAKNTVPTICAGSHEFEYIRSGHYLYIDKTPFIKEWWESGEQVVLITRPRRFGKTLMMNTVNCFFSSVYANRADLFEGLEIWKDEKMRKLQGSLPVIFLSFAAAQSSTIEILYAQICNAILDLYEKHNYLLESPKISQIAKTIYNNTINALLQHEITVKNDTAKYDPYVENSINVLSNLLCQHYGQQVVILLDEYDTPIISSYVAGYWEILKSFFRSFFCTSFKNNPYLTRALMTGGSTVSRESLLSALNNVRVYTCTSNRYARYFGFEKEEVYQYLELYGLGGEEYRKRVKAYYDGFHFGKLDIYNPYSFAAFLQDNQFLPLEECKFKDYWVNATTTSLETKLLHTTRSTTLEDCEKLLRGESLTIAIDEALVFAALDLQDSALAMWSILFANGYLTTKKQSDHNNVVFSDGSREVVLTNQEIQNIFGRIFIEWFFKKVDLWNDFIRALLENDVEKMMKSYHEILDKIMCYFDKVPGVEIYYHAFTLGLLAQLSKEYYIKSNNANAYGRFDCIVEPMDKQKDAYVLEFKVVKKPTKKNVEKITRKALNQIEEKHYTSDLLNRGFKKEQIKAYAFVFYETNVAITADHNLQSPSIQLNEQDISLIHQQGIQQGQKESKLLIAKKLKEQGASQQFVINLTGISLEEFWKL